jgi:HD domain
MMGASAARQARWGGLQFGVISAGAIVAAASLAQVAVLGVRQPAAALGFLTLVTAGEICRFSLPGGGEVAPVASAGALGYCLLLAGAGHPAGQAVAVAAMAVLVGAAVHAAAGRELRWEAMASRLVPVAIVATSCLLVRHPDSSQSGGPWLIPAVLLMAASGLADILLGAVIRSARNRARIRTSLTDERRARGAVIAATGAAAVILAAGVQAAGPYGLLAFAVPILAVQVTFRRLASRRVAALQAARGLPRTLEVAGYVPVGHVRRVSELAVAVGRELAMTERELLDLEYAALLHDIGQISLPRPAPGGLAILSPPCDQSRIAAYGAQMITRAGGLDRVADIVRCQYDPLSSQQPAAMAGQVTASRPVPPLASCILKVVNAYDEMLGADRSPGRSAAILDLLRLDLVPAYDPRVIDALHRTLA